MVRVRNGRRGAYRRAKARRERLDNLASAACVLALLTLAALAAGFAAARMASGI